ncbi:tRNA dimethylallyltransferase [Keratinibaculum paraultunense]|uniref:tRNA dimethylallyltransferase n=1 Tax=Keratinibaculum paraultunense TaxID=1278232 RepID=A0A4R3KYY5_9FIRM|nr:tRNA (adenosine(37)-N6)-dimethylallyltransferase MiaA [Keratinibaculum paraultunense]QQY80665.1 tRNA (adenosine(37)-N6)-dimethylallyltransferase MiaA [Keratinibaculum paraultunense]TCS91400.1 tRNA dimethylallyltransferase [Keratinibaculum paraultunense]
MKEKDNLVVLLGPTAVGKTSISIELAKKINGEIISADSMQIYKYMDIGTAKITKDEMDDIPHYMIDIIYPDEEFTVADFKKRASEYIRQINDRNNIPMIVGGTGLYINSIVYELKFARVKPNEKFRNKWNNIADKYGNQYIYEELKNVDPLSAKRINVNDRKRIIRALEILHETGKPMSYYNKNFRKETEEYNLVMIGFTMDRAKLYSRINKRVDNMLEQGLIEEVKMLMDMGYTKDLVSMQGIGYKEVIDYLEGNTELNQMIEILKRNTRRFAKRQLTWFRRDNRIKWIDVDQFDSIDSISIYLADYILKSLNIN